MVDKKTSFGQRLQVEYHYKIPLFRWGSSSPFRSGSKTVQENKWQLVWWYQWQSTIVISMPWSVIPSNDDEDSIWQHHNTMSTTLRHGSPTFWPSHMTAKCLFHGASSRQSHCRNGFEYNSGKESTPRISILKVKYIHNIMGLDVILSIVLVSRASASKFQRPLQSQRQRHDSYGRERQLVHFSQWHEG
jgi:hypothetical protein